MNQESNLSSLTALFSPRNVAVVGASRHPGKLGHTLVKNLLDYRFPGPVYPVNLEGGEVLGLKAYARVSDIKEKMDLVLVSVPAQRVMEAVEDCAATGVSALVILSSGFGEAGTLGQEAEAKIHALAKESGMRVLGPNCMGIYNVHANLNGTYFWELPRLAGKLSFLSQSGAYGGILFKEVHERGLGVSKFVSLGNQLDIGFAELLLHLGADDDTEVIALFVEGIKDGQGYLRAAAAVARKKPIIAMKAGRSQAGTRAARSHTGSMAGVAQAYEAAFKQAGILLVSDTDEFFDLCQALSRWHRHLPRDNRVAIATISGGPCVIASDVCEEQGLAVPLLSQEARALIQRYIPAFGADSNPVDMTPQMAEENFQPCLDALFSAPEVSGVIGINVGLDTPKFSQAFIAAQARQGKPLVAFTLSVPQVKAEFKKADIPVFSSPERAVKAYSGLVKYKRFIDRPESLWLEPGTPASTVKSFLSAGKQSLNEYEAKQVLREYDILTCQEIVAEDFDGAREAARSLGFPLVVKALGEKILHKTEQGAIFLGVSDEDGLRKAVETIRARFPEDKILLQEQIPPGLEVLVGARRDPTFGPVIAFGLGGIWTEILKDLAFRIAPLRPGDAVEMVTEIKGYPLLKGFRGGPAVNEDQLLEVLLKVSDLMTGNPEIEELDINPFIARGEQVVAVDALILLKKPQ